MFKTPCVGSATEIEHATSCSTVKRSTYWANPAEGKENQKARVDILHVGVHGKANKRICQAIFKDQAVSRNDIPVLAQKKIPSNLRLRANMYGKLLALQRPLVTYCNRSTLAKGIPNLAFLGGCLREVRLCSNRIHEVRTSFVSNTV